MNKQSLSDLFSSTLFTIPDYQRGYAWEKKQWRDFVEDLDALVTDDNIHFHYTGTVVTYQANNDSATYGRRPAKLVDVVDGQQRLTTTCLYLSVLIRTLIKAGRTEYERDIADFLYDGLRCKLTLNNDTSELFHRLLSEGRPLKAPVTPHQRRLCEATDYFQGHVDTLLADADKGTHYLTQLFEAITGKLVFTSYTIEEECEIGMTFELMNSRGKELSVLELLKNYLMHWIARNGAADEREELTARVNLAWRDTYGFVGDSSGNESQCLRLAWTLYCHHLPKNWKGYEGFKQPQYLPLRNFAVDGQAGAGKTKAQTKAFLLTFVKGLPEVARHYQSIVSPSADNTDSPAELAWLQRINNSGNIANFLPLLVAARSRWLAGTFSEAQYIELLQALECYAYRVFLFEGRRSNSGSSTLYRWGHELFNQDEVQLEAIVANIHDLIRYYASDSAFVAQLAQPGKWYHWRRLLKYTLFEYEQHLMDKEGKGSIPKITWEELARDSTLEHILPQNPAEGSHWLAVWDQDSRATYQHDLGNLVLTKDNASYSNFEFQRKKGAPGVSPSYSDSCIKQERKLAQYSDWTPETLMQRRQELESWILGRWQSRYQEQVTEPEQQLQRERQWDDVEA
ncbi:DUF262 domain-containing protein [Ferrimonas kyonanensis]|uniref:DUF262 domain-containing protein n=1 Tax=Ferrimonas kyonanensis TaxID=364763 RepID=UPI00040E7872|nr:DUF262 domain-containing protein [Ferrimonas kyonanensis]